jgi:hypothetical protein
VKYFYNARNAISYIQDIEAFRDGVSDIQTVEDIAMKSLKQWSIYLQLLMSALRLPRPELGSLNRETRGHQGRSRRTIERSILPITRIVETTKIIEITNSSLWSRRRRGLSVTPLT